MVSFFPNVFLFTGHFFPENFSDRLRTPPLRVDLNPLACFFPDVDLKSHICLSGNFVPVGRFFPGQHLNFFTSRLTEVGCGVEVVGAAPFGEDGCQERYVH